MPDRDLGSHNCQLKAIAGHARRKTIYALTRYNSWKGTTTMDDETKRGIEYLRGIVESGKVLRLGEPHVSGNFNYWHYFLAGGPLIPWPIFAFFWQMWGFCKLRSSMTKGRVAYISLLLGYVGFFPTAGRFFPHSSHFGKSGYLRNGNLYFSPSLPPHHPLP